jgi:hypothetical protein
VLAVRFHLNPSDDQLERREVHVVSEVVPFEKGVQPAGAAEPEYLRDARIQ